MPGIENTNPKALRPCPFCACSMAVKSNRDWHRAFGEHLEDCLLWDNDTLWPADEAGLHALVACWNGSLAATIAKPITYLREIDAGTDNSCFVIANKVEPGSFPAYGSAPLPGTTVTALNQLADSVSITNATGNQSLFISRVKALLDAVRALKEKAQ